MRSIWPYESLKAIWRLLKSIGIAMFSTSLKFRTLHCPSKFSRGTASLPSPDWCWLGVDSESDRCGLGVGGSRRALWSFKSDVTVEAVTQLRAVEAAVQKRMPLRCRCTGRSRLIRISDPLCNYLSVFLHWYLRIPTDVSPGIKPKIPSDSAHISYW